jgi:hypothetical protein
MPIFVSTGQTDSLNTAYSSIYMYFCSSIFALASYQREGEREGVGEEGKRDQQHQDQE